jgi:hypothetical protein
VDEDEAFHENLFPFVLKACWRKALPHSIPLVSGAMSPARDVAETPLRLSRLVLRNIKGIHIR